MIFSDRQEDAFSPVAPRMTVRGRKNKENAVLTEAPPCIPKLSVRFGAPVSNRLRARDPCCDSGAANGLSRLQAGAPQPTAS